MSASPEFYKPAAPAAFTSPCASPLPAPAGFVGFGADDYYSCRTPTGSGITYLKEPTTCPPAPRKPPAPLCKKRLFHLQQTPEVPLISVSLDELERTFRPHHPPPKADKRRRSLRHPKQQQHRTLDSSTSVSN
ncbi:hypothetical protein SEVIR_9G578100v4 [Setaria viridis]|uniref:Uncharacterized protein n=2 Tax=Setaria TaxID=4554 RepID=K4AL55_SETIT|nr:cyclin-dependent protein kinase inhibitor EL2 [Setaria italica]XP_034573309.1 cyclin-dependent protein kinase inhibitor EL2-like [Setaria viridis]TKV98721.1 hypothetical protein SEVIR_9G578100v2 [Setaria viridis]